jgi:hypothetical protein
MKNLLILATMLFTFGLANAQITEIFNNLKDGKELLYTAVNEGCLTITKSSMKQSYSDNCAKPIDFTVNNISLIDNTIVISLIMHYYGEVKLVGVLKIKDNELVLSYGESSESEQQVDKYKLK